MTYAGLLRKAALRLRAVSSTPSLDARFLMTHACGHDAAWLLAHGTSPVPPAMNQRFLAMLERRAAGEPAAYITGSVGFYGRTFTVTPDVLVPRPETEHLIEAVLEEVRAQRGGDVRIADIGTGSGAIAVTLACELPGARLYASDVSGAALAVARGNAERLGVAARVAFREGDLALPLAEFAPFTCVVANLPYIKSPEIPMLPHSVAYEPHVALDGGDDGLRLYRRLAEQLPALLAPGASLFFEAAPDTIPGLVALAEEMFARAHVEIGEDYAGLERYVAVCMP